MLKVIYKITVNYLNYSCTIYRCIQNNCHCFEVSMHNHIQNYWRFLELSLHNNMHTQNHSHFVERNGKECLWKQFQYILYLIDEHVHLEVPQPTPVLCLPVLTQPVKIWNGNRWYVNTLIDFRRCRHWLQEYPYRWQHNLSSKLQCWTIITRWHLI